MKKLENVVRPIQRRNDMKITLTNKAILNLVKKLAHEINRWQYTDPNRSTIRIYPIPRGGIPVAYALHGWICCEIVDRPEDANCFVDDLIDSGATCERYCDQYPEKPFFALIDKREDEQFNNKWIVFPWEQTEKKQDESGTDIVIRLLQLVGEDPQRGGLSETPHRVIKAWRHWCSGYNKEPAQILKVFEDGAEKYDEMVTVKNIPIYSHCEHHLAPIFGTVTISYIPDGKIVGLSKLSRLADMFARRLQVQERLTSQIADALFEHLQPKGVGVLIKARHLCMESRGICQQGHETITTALRGVMLVNPEARAEFLDSTK